MARQKHTFLSLFSGCGGLDSGFLGQGFVPLGAYDLDSTAIATYRSNFGSWANQQDLRHWRTDIKVPKKPSVVIAGPPCQGFSLVGAMAPRDRRNQLFIIPIEVGIATKAELIIVENVPGIRIEKYHRMWRRARRMLEAAGYRHATFLINAAHIGVAQNRERVVFVAARHELPDLTVRRKRVKPLEAVLNIGLSAPDHQPISLSATSKAGMIASAIAQGQKLCNVRAGSNSVPTWRVPEVFGRTTSAERDLLENIRKLRRQRRVRARGDSDPVPLSVLAATYGPDTRQLVSHLLEKGYLRHRDEGIDLRHTFNGKFRRLQADKPSHAVLSTFCDATHFLHPFEQRGFTPREAARVQGFPDDFRFLGSVRQQARVIGNAVPPPVSDLLASWAIEALG